jgi:hypothetical protein
MSVMDEVESHMVIKDNILYASATENTLVRALPKANASNMLDYVISEYVTTVYDYAFYKCETIKRIEFGNSLREYGLGIGAFYDSSINVVDLSRCVDLVDIKELTFSNCKKLHEVIFPIDGGLISLGPNLFVNCLELSAITLADTIEEFRGDMNAGDSNTFINCALEELILPKNFKRAGRFFITDCHNLKKLVFSDFYKSVGSGGSDRIINCQSLEEIVLPIFTYTDEDDNIVVVNEYFENDASPFSGCPSLVRYTLNEKDNNKMFISNNGVIYKIGSMHEITGVIEEQPKELSAVPTGLSALTIDADTKTIGSYSMKGCDKLLSLVIPEGVETIKRRAFVSESSGSDAASNLQTISLPKSLKTLGEYAFDWCINLTGVTLYENITTLPTSVFRWCKSLETVKILGNITNIDRFAFNYCESLKELILLTEQAPNINHGGYKAETDSYDFHPFGYNTGTYAGSEGINMFYTPYHNSGYDRAEWTNPLLREDKCNFKHEALPLNQNILLVAYGEDGTIMTDETLFFFSESGEFVFRADNSVKSAFYNVDKGGYEVVFDNNIYHGERVDVYTDTERVNFVGSFTALYGVNNYEVGNTDTVLSYSPRSLFSTNLFGTTATETNTKEEMAQITKSEYDKLVSRINLLTEIINKLK